MMKKIFLTLIFIAGMTVSAAIYFPLTEAGRYALSFGHRMLEGMGMDLTYSDVSGNDGRITVDNVRLTGMTEITFTSLTLKPEVMTSILTFSPVCNVEFKGCNVRFGQNLNIGDGALMLTAGREEILLENLRTNGEFSINGWLTLDRASNKIGRAEALLTVPESFEGSMDMLKNFLPLVKEGGRWYLRRNGK